MERRNGGIRNLSMKKFGTPIGAAPGRASEKVGLAVVGAPSVARPGLDLWPLFLALRWTSEMSFLPLMLPARKRLLRWRWASPVVPWPLGWSFLSVPPCVRLGAPGVSLPSG